MLTRRVLVIFTLFLYTPFALANNSTLTELDSYWQNLAQSVKEGDFNHYSAAYHPDAVLVSGFKQHSYPIAKALSRWQQGFADTKLGKIQADVEFRWSARFYDETTAHETGIFKYTSTDVDGKESIFIAHISALLVKQQGVWLLMMEYQQAQASNAEFAALKTHTSS